MQGAHADCDDLEGWGEGWGRSEAEEGGDIHTHTHTHTHVLMANSCHTAETNTTL